MVRDFVVVIVLVGKRERDLSMYIIVTKFLQVPLNGRPRVEEICSPFIRIWW